MTPEEREEADRQIGVLCAGFNVPTTAARLDAYWRGLTRMSLPRLSRAVETAISEAGPDKLPTPKQLWRIGWGKDPSGGVDHERASRDLESANATSRRAMEADLASDELGTKLRALEALNARCDVTLEPGTIAHTDRKAWLREKLAGLTAQLEAAGRGTDYTLWRLTLHLTARDRRG